MNKANYIKLGMAVNSLVVLSQYVVKNTSILTILGFFAAVLIAVALVPICRNYENMWVFLLVFCCGIPFNLKFVFAISETGLLEWTNYEVGNKVILIETYLLLVVLEELIMGIVARLIWKKQCEILQ